MKRNWEIEREILIKIENSKLNESITLKDFPDDQRDEVIHHANLLYNSGYIEAIIPNSPQVTSQIYLNDLTMNGYELLEFLRQKTVWGKFKTYIKEKGLDLSLSAIQSAGPIIISKFFNS